MTREQAVEILDSNTNEFALRHLTKEQAIKVIEEACKIACECIRESIRSEVKIEWIDIPSVEEDLLFEGEDNG